MKHTSRLLPDLHSTRERLRLGQTSAVAELERCIDVARSKTCEHVFLQTLFDQARASAADPTQAALPLAGLAVSVKDLFDIQGQV
ncbi:MAG: amidase, partial [Burkholderiaceae bacterium]